MSNLIPTEGSKGNEGKYLPRLDWRIDPNRRLMRGFIKEDPDITLFFIEAALDEIALKLSGAFIPDADERYRWFTYLADAQEAAEVYLQNWLERIFRYDCPFASFASFCSTRIGNFRHPTSHFRPRMSRYVPKTTRPVRRTMRTQLIEHQASNAPSSSKSTPSPALSPPASKAAANAAPTPPRISSTGAHNSNSYEQLQSHSHHSHRRKQRKRSD